ncbi:MAG: hypothetical protein AAF848_15260 [Pseudomonadota bacterium]
MIWAVYTLFQIAITPEPPIWLTSLLIIGVDRAIQAIASWARRLRGIAE